MSDRRSDDFTSTSIDSTGSSTTRDSCSRSETTRTRSVPPDAALSTRLTIHLLNIIWKVWGLVERVINHAWKMLMAETDKHQGLSGYFYPTSALRDDEEVVHSDNPSRWLHFPSYAGAGLLFVTAFLMVVTVLSGFGDNLVGSSFQQAESVPEKWWLLPVLMVVLGSGILAVTILMRTSTWHVITDKRVIERDHILHKDVQRISLGEVKTIEGKHPFPERMAGIGAIDIYTASTGGREMRFEGVPHAEESANRIAKLRYQYLQNFQHQNRDQNFRQDQQGSHAQQPQGQSPDGSVNAGPQGQQSQQPPQEHLNDSSQPHGRDPQEDDSDGGLW